jgi:hypothetical protein
MTDTTFQSNAQVYLDIKEHKNRNLVEWAGPIPSEGDRIKLIDGNEAIVLVVISIEWVTTLTGDFGTGGLVAPSEVYIHAIAYGDRRQIADVPDNLVEIVSADRHPSLVPDPEG